MSWREFSALLRGLNPRGAVAAHYGEALERQRRAQLRGDPEAARRAAASFWAGAASL